jgi:outer membrane protein OmpA-like peptidoglycan-associated protein
MNMIKTTLAAAGTLALAASANATVLKEVVHSTNGEIVHSTNGECVLTQWDGVSDCASSDYELRTVYFDFDSAVLTPAAKAKLDTLAGALTDRHVKSVKIVGFADKIGTTGYNANLSKRRAAAVASYLSKKGIVVAGKSEVRGLGETSSKSECSGVKGAELKACLWRDRRVEVEIVN